MQAREPRSLAIVGLGPSREVYINAVEGAGDRHAIFDETWTINSFGSVLNADLVFHMDDVRIQMLRAPNNDKIAKLVEWLKRPGCRVITSRPHAEFPQLEAFPLERALNEFHHAYFNSTPAYALAYAILEGFTEINIYGCDYHYKGYSELEPGRACLEYWIGRAWERGIAVNVAATSTLLDTSDGTKLYGYDTVDIEMALCDGKVKIRMLPIAEEKYPSAQQIEARYDHNKPCAA